MIVLHSSALEILTPEKEARIRSMYLKKLRIALTISSILLSSSGLSMDAALNPSCLKPNQSGLKSLIQWIVADELTTTEKCIQLINYQSRKREADNDYFRQSGTDQHFRQKRAKIENSFDATGSITYRNLSTTKNSSSVGITRDQNKRSGIFTTISGADIPK